MEYLFDFRGLLRCNWWGSSAFVINFGFLDLLGVCLANEEMVSSSLFVLMEQNSTIPFSIVSKLLSLHFHSCYRKTRRYH